MIDIEIIKNIVITLNKKSGKMWASFVEVAKTCKSEHGLNITKDFFINNQDFRTYRTSNSSELYVSLSLDTYLINKITDKPKAINHLIHVRQTQPKSTVDNFKLVKRLSCINSCDDFERALIGILKDLIATSHYNEIEVTLIAKYFYQVYSSPIKAVLNSLISDLSLIDFLQCSNELIVKEANGKWIICLK